MGPFFPLGFGHWVNRVAAAAVILVFLAVLSPIPANAAQTSSPTYYIEETGHSLGGVYLDFWMANAGIADLGMPVSEPQAVAGGERQYFEYGVLDLTGDQVVAAEVGQELLELRHDPLSTAAGKRVGAEREAGAFAGLGDATGVIIEPSVTTAIDNDWLAKIGSEYDEQGGVERFGRPVSDVHFAMGKVIRWYSGGRVQAWNSPGAEATVATAGKELALLSEVDTTEIAVGDLLSISGVALAAGETGGSGDVAIVDPAGAVADPVAAIDQVGFADATGAFSPTRIAIPAIGVDAYIEQVGIYDGVMGTPAGPMNVGWYPAYSSPGQGGNVVMAGHVDYVTVGAAVFYSLGSLGAGSEIYVTGPNGEGFTYSVTGSTVVGANTPAENVLGGPGGESLTLITCGGNFNGVAYDSRTIVYAVRI